MHDVYLLYKTYFLVTASVIFEKIDFDDQKRDCIREEIEKNTVEDKFSDSRHKLNDSFEV